MSLPDLTDLVEPLVDDVSIVQALLDAALPDCLVSREFTSESTNQFPIVIYNLDGSDEPGVVNGPGLWDTTLMVWVWAETDEQVWDICKRLHFAVASWDVPGYGYLPGVGGVERSDTLQKFADIWDAEAPTKIARESRAAYRLLVRSSY